MGSNYMLIGPNVAIEPAVDGGFMVLVNGQQWCPNDERCDHVWESTGDAWAAYRDANPNAPNLTDMASKMVGDGKTPNLYFVTIEGNTLAAFEDYTRALDYATAGAQEGTPAAQEWEVVIEDRLHGVIWENAASRAAQGVDTCEDGGPHVMDHAVEFASADDDGIVVDVWCEKCGQSGSLTISPEDVSW